jgi:hypothetical protein
LPATPKQFYQGQVPTTLTTVYTAPASPGYAEILSIVAVNTSSSTGLTVSIHVVPPAGTAGVGNAIAYNWNIDVLGLPFTVKPAVVVPAGGTIQVVASGIGITLTISGLEVT